MLKRICAFCLVMALATSLITLVPVSAASDSDIQLVIDLGIIDIEDEGLIPKGFNRADFARSLCIMERNDNPPQISAEDAASYASDIASNANINYIAAVLSAGYMENDDAGKFNSTTSISMRDALTACVKMLGYEPMAQANGGTYNDYYKIALKMGILKGVTVADNEKLTSQEVAELLTNTMGAKMFLPENINYGEDCLWDRWNITVCSGKILANSNMGLLIERTEPGFVNIDGNIYYTDLLIDNSIVGSNVTYYTMYGDLGDEVISISVKSYADTVTLQSEEIKSTSENSKIFTIKTEDKKEIKVDKKGFLIVNGKTLSPTRAIFDAFKSGTATFIDSDNNGIYDVVHMTLLLQTVIEGVNPDGKTLATRFDNQIIKLEDIESYEVYLGKKVATLYDLKAGMTVGIACDSFSIVNSELVLDFTNAKYLRLYASNRSYTGYITSMLSDGRFEIDDMVKSFGSGYTRLVEKGHIMPLSLGEYVTVYYDTLGKLTYYEFTQGSMSYGYLIDAWSYRKATEVEILDTNGEFNIFKTGKTFILDGSRVDSGSITYSVNSANDVDLSKRQLIRYRIEDGILKEIDTTIVRASKESTDSSLDAVLPFDVAAVDNPMKKIRSGAIDRQYAFKNDCVMFIDEAPLDGTGFSKMQITVKNGDVTDGEYYLSAYDSNTNNEIACIVRHDSYNLQDSDAKGSLPYYGYACYIVKSVRNSMNKNGDWGWRLSLVGESKEVTHFVSEDNIRLYATTMSESDWAKENINVYKQDESNFTTVIKEGDIIRFSKNAADEIVYIEKMFDFEDHMDTLVSVPNKGGQIYGYVNIDKISGDNVIYDCGDPDNNTYIFKRRSELKTVPLYHVSTGEVELVNLASVPSASSGSTVKAFLRYYNYGIIYDHIFYVYD